VTEKKVTDLFYAHNWSLNPNDINGKYQAAETTALMLGVSDQHNNFVTDRENTLSAAHQNK